MGITPFYKYFEQLSAPFEEIGDNFKNLELNKGKIDIFEKEIEKVYQKIRNLLNELRIEETSRSESMEFPKLKLKDSTSISQA